MMPKVDINRLSSEARKYANLICKKDGEIRASKPNPKKSVEHGRATYVWRMVVFNVSPNPKHHCMPVTADFGLHEEDWKNRYEIIRNLDTIVDEIIDTIPANQWHGVIRWGQAFGLIGRPMIKEDGSVIYR